MPVEFWRMGATPMPVTEIGRLAQQMETGGWDGLAVGEAHGLLPDPYVALAIAAAATTTLKVGTAVAVPLRHPLLAADAMATVQGIAGGRAGFSIGRGDGAMKVLQRKPMPAADFEAYLRQLLGFLRGEVVDMDGVQTSMKRLGVIDPSLDTSPPPVNVAATGPRMIAMAASYADGVSFAFGADLERIARGIDLVRRTCVEQGRDPSSVTLGSYVQLAVCHDDDDRERARDAIRGLIMTHSRFSEFEGKVVEGVQHEDRASIKQSFEAMERTLRTADGGMEPRRDGRPGELEFYARGAVDGDFIDRFGIIGDADYCARRLQEIVDLGVQRIYIGTRGVGADIDEENTRRIGRDVLPLVRRVGTPA